MTVVGSPSNGKIVRTDSNLLHEISAIQANFDSNNKKLNLKFFTNGGKYDYGYVDSGDIVVLLANPKDITIFQYYHLLDAYGIYISSDESEMRY